jgi:hypothetical protein
MPKLTWNEFRAHRFHACNFFGVVDKEGNWVDSSIQFHTAVMFAAWHEGHTDVMSAEAVCLLNELQMSVVHSSMLEKMYEAGLVK